MYVVRMFTLILVGLSAYSVGCTTGVAVPDPTPPEVEMQLCVPVVDRIELESDQCPSERPCLALLLWWDEDGERAPREFCVAAASCACGDT